MSIVSEVLPVILNPMYDIFPVLPESFLSSLDDEARSQINDLQLKLDRGEELPSGLISGLPPYMAEDKDYIRHVILPALFLVRSNAGERLTLPLLDTKKVTKQDALPYQLWGLLYDGWNPNPVEEGTTVFLTGYEGRGPDNRRKRIYYSATTPDLYPAKYQEKIVQFFSELFSNENANLPLMRKYLDTYFDLYWNLHLGVTGDDLPDFARDIGMSFNTVLAYGNPLEKTFYDHYIKVRQLRGQLIAWIDTKVQEMIDGSISNPDQTLVYYWLKNSNDGEDPDFRRKDIVFECFHNFVALSQWGNTIYNIMLKLLPDDPEYPTVREYFGEAMTADYNQEQGEPFTTLDRFVMELFRTISPNGGSISKIEERKKSLYERYNYIVAPHKETSEYEIHWENPTDFNPNRYQGVPTSDQIDETKCQEIGFAQCPFHKTEFQVQDGRNTQVNNSTFGTLYNVTDGTAYPVSDYAGYAPFGFGYRRCPGELFTVEVIKDFLRKVASNGIEFQKLEIPDPEMVPVGPGAVVPDNIGFMRLL